jgi:hypothetical protein
MLRGRIGHVGPFKVMIGLGRRAREQGTIGPRGSDSVESSRVESGRRVCTTDLDFVRRTGQCSSLKLDLN